MAKLERLFKIIDTINEKIGRGICYALIALMLIQVMEVVLRYIFNNPTIWAWDVNGQIFAGAGIVAGAYALLHDTHVRLDILYRGWSPKRRAIVDLITFPLIVVALCAVIWKGGEMAWWSWKTNEHFHSYFAPILWPVKCCLPIAGFLMLLQTIVKYGRLFIFLRKPVSES